MRHLFTVLLLFAGAVLYAQETTGSVIGVITDKEMNNDPLPFANVQIKGSTKGTTTDMDGLYEISGVEPGTYTIVISFVGYETLEVPNISVQAGKVTELNTALGAGRVSLDEVVVTTTARRDSETALLLDQKKAVEIKTSIGAQELTRKGVSDAEGAVTKISGVSKQEGVKNIFVRGLGDRYNSTTMNGLPLPSDDPEYKNISLDIFSSNIVESIDVNKTFSTGLYGDIGGANVNISSKTLAVGQELILGVKTGINTNTVSKDYLTIDGTNFLGYKKSMKTPITDIDTYDFQNSLNPNSQNLQIDNGLSLGAGKKFMIGDSNALSMYVYGSANGDYNYRKGNIKQANAQGFIGKDLNYDQYNYAISKIAMGNFKYLFGDSNSVSYNTLLIDTDNQSLSEYDGKSVGVYDEDDTSIGTTFIRRQQVNNTTLYVNQLLSELSFNKFNVSIGGSYNTTTAYEPDRRTNTFIHDVQQDTYYTATGTSAYNNRYYSELDEKDLAGNLVLGYKLGEFDNETNNRIEVGVNYRNNKRDFNAYQYNHNFDSQIEIEKDNPDAIFNQENLDNGVFNIIPIDQYYSGERTTVAALVNFIYDLSPSTTLNIGVRGESIQQEVEWNTTVSSSEFSDAGTIDHNYLLPSVNLRYKLSDKNIFRIAASKTYILPQYKEVAPFLYEDVNFSSQGNPDLKASDVYNFDLKWDYYFSNEEIVSLTGFYKYIKNPINRVYVASAAYVLSYINPGDKANVAGIEAELKKKIFNVESEESTSSLFYGLNASYLYSIQDLTDKTAAFTNTEDQLQGASPFLINTDLTYRNKSEKNEFAGSVVFNYFSNRIYSLGSQNNENIMERSVPTLDFVFSNEFNENISLSLKFLNILNPSYQLTQEIEGGDDVIIGNYKKGINMSLGLTYKF
ncbi:TonB-dependent receptor [Galbibacter pacificus]|uniref:Carboxypeptidase-like regulatory domain-containing protein n=1 Tax=Galbibacter pacificus TaxID=2996052 RepID=A0ABT6FWE3_9FLAO|nr:TonB-dependent receptor [Galbibacter pacificus]MDG3583978.1 carboxypeptidase-like regulatory domain-containing protein [Galbibacter pacificus]MDG3587585.1 carboxypeptidase-like regulatory domain-containing protein [Galbibacter pacificus]